MVFSLFQVQGLVDGSIMREEDCPLSASFRKSGDLGFIISVPRTSWCWLLQNGLAIPTFALRPGKQRGGDSWKGPPWFVRGDPCATTALPPSQPTARTSVAAAAPRVPSAGCRGVGGWQGPRLLNSLPLSQREPPSVASGARGESESWHRRVWGGAGVVPRFPWGAMSGGVLETAF